MKKSSYKVLWNVFLLVICGGSLIYGFAQQQKMVESKVQMGECQQQVATLMLELEQKKSELEMMNKQLSATLMELQTERNSAFRARSEAKRK